MCNLDTEGTKHGCGHYVITNKLRKYDCNNQFCALSVKHNPDCQDCQCDKFMGPDRSEKVTATTPNYCGLCQYWYKGPGSVPRR